MLMPNKSSIAHFQRSKVLRGISTPQLRSVFLTQRSFSSRREMPLSPARNNSLATHIYFFNVVIFSVLKAWFVEILYLIILNRHCLSPYYSHQLRYFLVQQLDRKSTRLNSSHANISYAVFC